MTKSLQDQLLKSGLVDEKKAKSIGKQKRKEAKQVPKGQEKEDETTLLAKQALAEKTARDREQNKELQFAAEQKAIQAQIKQLIEINKIDRGGGEVAYQFVDQKKIKKIYVAKKLVDQLALGQIAVTKLDGRYELVPKVVAEKIAQRNLEAIIVLNEKNSSAPDEDDPYADYRIPDDLMW